MGETDGETCGERKYIVETAAQFKISDFVPNEQN